MRRIALAVVIVSILILIPTNLNSTPFRPTESPLLGSSPGTLAEGSESYSGSGEPLEYSIGGTTDTAPTTFSATNGSSFVNWTAEVLIPQPNDTLTSDIEVYYPMTEWGPTKVIDPLECERTEGTEWDYAAGTLTIYNSSVDVYGVWLVKFISLNYMEDLQLGVSGQSLSDSAILNVGDNLTLRATSPWIENARVGLELTDPTGEVWFEDHNITGTPSTAWHIPSFANRIPLTISNSNVDADLTNFPLLVDMTENSLKDSNNVQSDGDDIVFVQNGEVLSHELVRFTQSTGKLTAWVKTNLSSSVDNTVYMYYGNPVVGPTENATAVWTNGYEAAWHLDETYSDEADGNVHYDSTTGGYDGVQHGNYYNANGIAYYAQLFDGTDDWISVNATEGLEPEGNVTISGWFNLESEFNSSATTTQIIMSKYLDQDRDMVIALVGDDYGGDTPNGSLVWKVESYANKPRYKFTTKRSWSPGWYHYSVTLDSDSMSNNKVFIDAVDLTDSGDTGPGTTGNLSFSADWGIGGGTYEPPNDTSAYLDGSIDEVRVATGLRSSAWIAAEYDNQQPSSTFVTKGSPTQRDSPEHTFTKNIDLTAPAGKWTARTYYNDTGTSVTNKTGLYERNFIVKHDTSLILKSPGDAVGDELTTKIAGEMLYVVLDLEDSDNTSDYVEGATVTMNWTVDGTSTQKTLVDHGNGTYSRTLNTTDLATEGRWRINIDSYHPYYNNASYYFDLDLSHETEILYETPPSTPYGDDFTVRITVRDAFNGEPIPGAAISSNGSLIGISDNADGTYDLTLNSTGLSTGNYVYHVNASPTETYLLQSTVDITFTLRDIHTATYGIGGNSVSTPYDIDTSFTVTYNDTDHNYEGILEANWSVSPPSGVTVVVTDNNDGSYGLAIDVSGKDVGTYNIEVAFWKDNYENTTFLLELTITQHDTFIVVDLDQEIPWGENSTFSVTWYDSDTGDTDISESVAVSDITVNGTSYGQNLGFDLDSDDLTVGIYHLKVTLYSGSDNYGDAWTNVTLEIRAHHTYIEVNYDEEVPWDENSTFVVSWYDSDDGGSQIGSSYLSQITVGSDSFDSFSFEYDTSSLSVGSYQRDVDLTSSDVKYTDTHTVVNITIRAHYTYVEVNYDEEVPWGENSTFVVTWYDADTGGTEISGNIDNVTVGSQSFEQLTFEYDIDDWPINAYQKDVHLYSSNETYCDASTKINITIREHYTYINIDYDQKIPWGENSTFAVTWYDSDTGGTNISGTVNVSDVTVNGSSYGTDLEFNFDSNDLTVDSYQLNVTLYSENGDYESAWTTVTLEIRAHHTTVTVDSSPVTPWGYDTDIGVIFWDEDTNSSVPIDNVTTGGVQFDYGIYGSEQFSDYSPTLSTSSWTVDTYAVTLSVSCKESNRYYDSAFNNFTITIRAHHTTVSAVVEDATPWGFNTSVMVTFWDSDNNEQVPVENVSSIDFNPTGYDSQSTTSYSSILTTDYWDVDKILTTATVQCTSSNLYYKSASGSFNITIRTHHTTLAAVTTETTPWGYDTDVIVTFWDTDTDTEVPIDNVTSIEYTSSTYGTQTPTKSYTPTLDTSTWDVGKDTVTIQVDCADGNTYYESQSSTFDVTIRAHHTYIEVNYDEEVPWGENSTFIVSWYDADTGGTKINGNLDNVTVGSQSFEQLTFEYDIDDWPINAYQKDVHLYSSNETYCDASTKINITIREHYTYINIDYDQKIPWGENSTFNVTWFDSDLGGADISGSVAPSDITVDGVSYGSNLIFNLDSDSWTVGTYKLNVTLYSSDDQYDDTWSTITLEIRAHHTTVSVDSSPVTPWGYDTNSNVVFWDEDTNSTVPIENVSTNGIEFNYGSYGSEEFNTYSPNLSTSSWTVGTQSVTLNVSCVNSNQFYNSASKNFNITIRAHHTTVTAVVDAATPWCFNTSATVTFWDTDNDEQVPIGNVSSIDFNPTGYGSQTKTSYRSVLTTDNWDVGIVNTAIFVSCDLSNRYYDSASSSFNITIRPHHTTLSAVPTSTTPWGNDTDVIVTFWDVDTDSKVPIENVTSISYSSAYETQSPTKSYTPTLSTSTWGVGIETVMVQANCADGNAYYNAKSSTFNITIRAHETSVSVKGSLTVPYGNYTPVTVVFWDNDWNQEVPIENVSTDGVAFVYETSLGTQEFSNYSMRLNTSSWSVDSHSVDLSVTCIDSNRYYNSASHTFSITIRRLGIRVTHEPTDLIIPSGDDFNIVLRVNVSELGNPFDGYPVQKLNSSYVVVDNSTHVFSITWEDLTNGRYNLTISNSELTDESYRIKITIKKSFGNYSSDYIVVEFRYRDARSYLASPSYPQVTTPYDTDIQVRLNYTDVDRNRGITTATITADGIEIYNEEHLGDGEYVVTLNVSGFDKGDHEFNLTAGADQYENKTLSFTLTIRIAYTYAIPTVGALDIPVGNDPVFYVDYWDTDHDKPVINASLETTWSLDVNVTYLPGEERYKIVFITEDTTPLQQNTVVTFNFSKGENYQFGIFNLTITVRTHNTDFRLVSAIDPRSLEGVFDISVYYGDLDNNIGINSTKVEFRVEEETLGSLNSSWDYDDNPGFYTIYVNASQFTSLGIKTFIVYANWTGSVYTYKNRTFTTTANVVGQESSLTLLESAEPTPYLENMSYLLFFSDLNSGEGIDNDTGAVHIYVEFQGYQVNTSNVDIWEVDRTNQPGNYSIRFNTTVFSTTGRIYMNLNVNWSKGVEPLYTNRTDTISLRILPRDTLISLTPPSPTSYGENGTFTFTFEDVTGAEAQDILDDDKMTISLNISFTYSHSAGTFTIEFNTTSFGELGTKSLQLNVTWAGSPFYTNRTNRIIFIDVIARQTVLDYLAPAPTQYLDNVTFSVTWTDITGTSSEGIENAVVSIYNGSTAIGQEYYSVTVIGNGQYEIEFNTTYYDEPAKFNLNVTIYSPEFYYRNSTGIHQFTVRQRVTLLSSEPIRKVPYNSSITVILNYQDLYTLADIGNDSNLVALEILNGSDWFFTSEWKPAFGYYVVEIQTYNHDELNISDPTSLELRMSYEDTSPYYGPDTLFIEFELRIRSSSLSIDDTPENTPYNDNASLTVFYEDTDAEQGIEGGDIHVYNGSQLLNESAHYTLSSGSIGFYEISLNTSALGAPGQYTVNVYANWTSEPPYHDNATVSVRVQVRERDTNVEITVPPPQTRFLDNVTFSFVFTDLDAGEPIVGITVDDVKIYLQDGTELTSGFSLIQDGESFEISIPSDLITDTLVSNYELNVTVDWDESQSPYYSDDQTIVKVTVTNRIMSISLVPITTTPLRDNMTVEFTLTDDDTANPITGAIVEFDCQDPPLSEYTLTQGTGSDEGFYSISFNTTQLNATGTYSFDLVVKWNSTQQPYYANLSTITLRGAVDLIYTSLQNDPPNPSSVQYTDSVSVIVYFEDLDHNQTVEGATMHVHYRDTTTVPSNLAVNYLGSGAYNITFDTSNLAGTGSQTLNVTADLWPYTSRTVTPSFTVTVISTTLVPSQETIEIFWKEYANVSVDYNNLLDGNTTPGATVTYSWDGGSGVFEDSNGNGTYTGPIDTELANAGTRVVTITAEKDKFATSVTTLTLVVKTLPSEIISITPAELVQTIDRGSEVNITVYLNDTTYESAIDNSYVDEVYATFEKTDYTLSYNDTPGYYTATIPSSATILPIDFYTVRLTAKLSNYDPASYQFKVNLEQTRTELSLTGDTSEDMVAVYSEVVNFTVLLTAPDLGATFSNATVSWYIADTGETGNFTNAGDGVYWVAFNTTADAPGFGIWGLSFKARPYTNASEFAGSTASLSLTVKKIATQVDRPPSLEVYWGWKGNVSFTYVDLSFNDTIPEADAPYGLSEIRGNAIHIGEGEYLVTVDTSLLVPDTYQLSLTFTKENYQEATAVVRITVLEVPTEIVPEAPEKNRVENASTDLVVPVGESLDITFFYNDTDDSDGYVGGLENAANITGISHPSLLETIRFDLQELGDGYYRYSFDTASTALYQDIEGGPRSSPQPYTLLVKLELANRTTATIRISVTIIDVPTELSTIQVDRNLLYGDRGRIVIYYNDTWHNQPVTGANLSITGESELKLLNIEDSYPDEDRPGYYIVEYVAASPLLQADSGISTLVLRIEKENTEAQVIEQDVTVNPTQAAETLNTAFTFGTPISIVIILLLLAYIKIWSVPKRLRQINGQIKSLEKGKLPSPVEQAKSRQHLVAELYNDTYKEVELTKAPEEMPPEAIEVEVPELGELLMMLSILTKLTPEELEDFKGDIDKMRPSEKAAFIKEVIHQEAIRAAKREGKETDVIIEEVREDARKRLRGEEVPEEPEGAPEVREVEDVERILLEEEEEERLDEATPAEPGTEAPADRLSPYELEELKKDLQKRGVPPHEIDTIMKQAERLPRDLVDELLDSLDENGV